MRRPAGTSLYKPEVREARKFRLYVLAKAMTTQHAIDGGTLIPAGRMVFLLDPDDPHYEDEYVCDGFFFVSPNHYDPTSKLPKDVQLKKFREPRRVFVVPLGQERAWLKVAREKAGL